MNVMIRNYRDTDREQCRSLWRELVEWHREIYQDSKIGGEHPEDYFDQHLSVVGSNRLWVASYDSKIVGLIGLIVKGNDAEIEPLIVSKDYRHKKIGKQLVEKAISEAHQIGVKYLDVAPVARNLDAISFFHKMGFVNMGKVEMFMDFTGRRWESGLKFNGHDFNF